jgi:hypothetical protein
VIVITVARKPMSTPVVLNIVQYGTGGLNLEMCRVPTEKGVKLARLNKLGRNGWKNANGGANNAALYGEPSGRWPANFILQHLNSCSVTCETCCPVGELDRLGLPGDKEQLTESDFVSRFFKRVQG